MGRRWLGAIRILHFIGLAMFFGSIFGHIALGALPGAEMNTDTIVVLRAANEFTTRVLTVPGLILLLVTGIWMTLRNHGGFLRHRWLTTHQVLAVLILLNALLILKPLGVHLLELAQGLPQSGSDLSTFHQLVRREITFGLTNLVLTIAAVAVATYRPTLRKRGERQQA